MAKSSKSSHRNNSELIRNTTSGDHFVANPFYRIYQIQETTKLVVRVFHCYIPWYISSKLILHYPPPTGNNEDNNANSESILTKLFRCYTTYLTDVLQHHLNHHTQVLLVNPIKVIKLTSKRYIYSCLHSPVCQHFTKLKPQNVRVFHRNFSNNIPNNGVI